MLNRRVQSECERVLRTGYRQKKKKTWPFSGLRFIGDLSRLLRDEIRNVCKFLCMKWGIRSRKTLRFCRLLVWQTDRANERIDVKRKVKRKELVSTIAEWYSWESEYLDPFPFSVNSAISIKSYSAQLLLTTGSQQCVNWICWYFIRTSIKEISNGTYVQELYFVSL